MIRDFDQILDSVAEDLEWLPLPPVFLGGAVVPLFLDDHGRAEMCPTKDVDCIIPSIRSQLDFQHLTLELLDHGWNPVPGGPICRYKSPRRHLVDLMPLNASILGFKNRWCEHAVRAPVQRTLNTGRIILVPTAANLLACKLDAFMTRGLEAPYSSKDLEDVASLLDGCDELEDSIADSPPEMLDYLMATMDKIIEDSSLEESLLAQVPADADEHEAFELVRERLRRIADLRLSHEKKGG